MSEIEIHSKEITSANILKIEAGTNCPQGGDSGHGGRTVFRLTDKGGTNIQVKIDGKDVSINKTLEIVLSGDTESDTFVEALEFAINTYKHQQATDQTKKEDIL